MQSFKCFFVFGITKWAFLWGAYLLASLNVKGSWSRNRTPMLLFLLRPKIRKQEARDTVKEDTK